ncbi:MAG: TolC family protein [Verrucomicrobia bacterium]|nr:TolC family protein [Verrucomicrobiota bacterium]
MKRIVLASLIGCAAIVKADELVAGAHAHPGLLPAEREHRPQIQAQAENSGKQGLLAASNQQSEIEPRASELLARAPSPSLSPGERVGVRAGVNTNSASLVASLMLTPELVNQFAEEMRTNHPALAAAAARTNAAAAAVAAVRTWEDPTLKFGVMAAEEMMRKEDGDLGYGIEQKLPLWNKPTLARNVARAELAVEVADAEMRFQDLRSELARALFRTALAGQTVAIGDQDLAYLQTLAETTEASYGVGGASQFDLLQVQNERAKRAEQLKTDRARLAQSQLALNRLMNRELNTPWPTLELPPLAGPVFFNQRLVEFAIKNEPRLLMKREEIKQAEAMVAETRRMRLPDVMVGAESRNYSGNGEWRQAEFMLSFNLPLFNRAKYRADLQRSEARLKTVEAETADYTLAVREEVHNLTVQIDAARREAVLYRDEIIPRSETALASARAAWEAGRGMFRDVLDARRMLLDARLMFARAVAEQYQMMSELVLCCGLGDLEALQMIGAQPDLPENNSTLP